VSRVDGLLVGAMKKSSLCWAALMHNLKEINTTFSLFVYFTDL
jgi:hypothetical protein